MPHNQYLLYRLHGYILLAIFRKLHQVQSFIDFDRGKFGLAGARISRAGADVIEVSFGEPPSLADQNRIVIGFIIADE
jgi:hypothetical protein